MIELTGNSEEPWEHAAQRALDDASRTLENIHGFEIVSATASVEDGAIQRYETTIHVSFGLER